MNVLSLFDGMSCGQIALDQLGIRVDKYYASEVDKYAIAVTQHNYPNTIQMGDVTKWKEWGIDWKSIDLIYGGSPCQGFSFAGKQLAFDDPRSALFFTFVDILNYIKSVNPNVKFLLENVRMKKEYLDVISEYMGVQPVMINSALVSAQNRVRFYWTNIGEIEQPEDRGILLRDILEDGISYERTMVGIDKKKDSLCVQVGTADLNGHDCIKRVYSPEGKAPTLTTMGGGNTEPKVIVTETSKNDITNIKKGSSGKSWFFEQQTYAEDSKTRTLKAGGGSGNVPKVILDRMQWRKLTPLECERLQTVPDNYTLTPHPTLKNRMMSNSQRYKMLGNGWTVEVIKHIFINLINK